MGFDKLTDSVERGERVNSAIILVFIEIIYHLMLKMKKKNKFMNLLNKFQLKDHCLMFLST
jgi:hypothetical protein